jgi:hypothetical protein
MNVDRTRTTLAPHLRVWHLALLVLFVAVAIRNVQDQGRSEPALIVLAASGFVLYGVIGWLGWRVWNQSAGRLPPTPRVLVYLVGMAGLFLLATVVYLVAEHIYLVGWV